MGIDRAFDRALRGWRTGSERCSLLFSGGVDSSLLAWELRAAAGLDLVTVGLPGAPDLASARESAQAMGLRTRLEELTGGEVEAARSRWAPLLLGLPRARASAILTLGIALARAPAGTVLCGQGADELFLGYAHFEGLDAIQAGARSDADLTTLRTVDQPIVDRIGQDLGRRIAVPYLDEGFVSAALALPIELRLPRPTRKAFFRRWAVHRGLPPGVAGRPKRAAQFGTRVDRLMPRSEDRSAR
ncbi:MAG TPA: asparagine synthase-related protein [Thermoplasmata archaeon]|nr:asparagine synthase-related protein [Thermoplasmata archaeon]